MSTFSVVYNKIWLNSYYPSHSHIKSLPIFIHNPSIYTILWHFHYQYCSTNTCRLGGNFWALPCSSRSDIGVGRGRSSSLEFFCDCCLKTMATESSHRMMEGLGAALMIPNDVTCERVVSPRVLGRYNWSLVAACWSIPMDDDAGLPANRQRIMMVTSQPGPIRRLPRPRRQ